MKKIFFLLILITFLFSTTNKPVYSEGIDCALTTIPSEDNLVSPVKSLTLKFDGKDIQQELDRHPSGGELKFSFPGTGPLSCGRPIIPKDQYSSPTFGPIVPNDDHFGWRCDDDLLWPRTNTVGIIYELQGEKPRQICFLKKYTIAGEPSDCNTTYKYDGKGDVNDLSWRIVVSNIELGAGYNGIVVELDSEKILSKELPSGSSSFEEVTIPRNLLRGEENPDHQAAVYAANCTTSTDDLTYGTFCTKGLQICLSDKFEIAKAGATPKPTPIPTLTPTPTKQPDYCKDGVSCVSDTSAQPLCDVKTPNDCSRCSYCQPTPGRRLTPKVQIPDLKPLCDQLTKEKDYRKNCWVCQNSGGIWSAIGCLPTDFSALINKYVFTTGVGIAGGIAFLYFLYGAFMILTSTGNAERLEEAKQIITSSLAGLLLIIFSIFLLKTIGVDILQLPGFK